LPAEVQYGVLLPVGHSWETMVVRPVNEVQRSHDQGSAWTCLDPFGSAKPRPLGRGKEAPLRACPEPLGRISDRRRAPAL